VALTVSGGHTQLVHVKDTFDHELLGQTRDDAAGEAFDKIGKLLGLPYPAGPIIDRRAREGDPAFHDFPQSMLDGGFEFSFSGLKTSVRYYLQKQENQADFLKEHTNDLCASVSHAITEVLVKKLKKAVQHTTVKTIMLAGSDSAKSMLRDKARAMAEKQGCTLYIPKLEYCTDNAAMIAVTGYLKAKQGDYADLQLKPFASLKSKV